jgi:3-oxoacyl-[acyl-carrier protein] reductase
MNFDGKKVLVIGGSSGIGNGIAQSFKTAGAEVHVWGTRASAQDYASAQGSDLSGLHYAQMDASDYDSLQSYQPPFDALDVLVLCQGTVRYDRAEFEKDGWDTVMGINIDSVMHAASKFKPLLSAAKGSIIIVSSVAGFKANIGNPAYAASKAAAVSLTKTLGAAWARDGIRVNGLAPGLVPTKLTTVTTENEKRSEAALRSIPLRRYGTPEDMAGVALFLASPMAAYVQGHTIIADGGLTL